MFCTAINAFICALCTVYVCTPIHHEPIKTQTANLGVSPLLNDPTNEQLPYNHVRLTVKMTYCERKRVGGGQRLYDMLWLRQRGFMQLKWWGIFLLCRKDLGRPFVSTLLQCFEELGLGREVTRLLGGWRGGDEGGVRRVKSHLEARDGAEFHEQHLEFQLHHVGQTHSGTRQWEVGDGSWFGSV